MSGARVVSPASAPLRGTLSVPGDKSIAHRSLILGSLAEGTLRVAGLPGGADVRSTRTCLEALGASIREDEGALLVEGGWTRRPRPSARVELDCGNSGTTMRLLMGVLAGCPGRFVLTGDASLSRRPMRRVAEPLASMGAAIELSGGEGAPVTIQGKAGLAACGVRLSVPSAQVKSALLLAALSAEGESAVEDPFRTRDHTERMLAWLGADLRLDGRTVRLRPGPLRSDRTLAIPGDLSSAAYFAAAAALVPGSEVSVTRVGLNPRRAGFLDVLRRMGARIAVAEDASSGGEPVGTVGISHSRLKAARVAAAEVPALVDEIPLLAVVASQAEGTSRLEGLGELRVKESDRLAATAAALRAMGAKAVVEGDTLSVSGPCRLRGAEIASLGDHRIAMSFGVAALVADGETRIPDAACAAVSYPGFFDDLEGLRG
ncbi:MAG: 3-phosphoshikimate 1-carboxyvinyltransferase [Elusimicrobia bacterium]|nr:3-phosphoshikimate 1-carboxyvinyltransferase [Elusimicrobiota bacterium]